MRASLLAARSLLLGGWLGSWALFAFVIAPTAFRVLPSGDVAGALVSPILRSLHLYGLLAGTLLCAIAFSFREGRLRIGLPAVLALVCAISEFGVTAAISDIRPSGFGPGTPEDAGARFSTLHQLSRVLFGAVLAGVALLAVLASRATERPEQSETNKIER